jgi:hypothetical protein
MGPPMTGGGVGPPMAGGGTGPMPGGMAGPPQGGEGEGGATGEGAAPRGRGSGTARTALPSIGDRSFPDGTGTTILIVEAGKPVPWTKPEDVAYDPKKPVPAPGGAFANVFHAAFADTTVRALSRKIDAKALRALITPAGGEDILRAWLDPSAGNESPVRRAVLKRLQDRHEKLRDEAAALRDILQELREDVTGLRWAVEADRLMELDPEAAALKKKNDQLEKAIKDGRDEAKKLIAEVERLKKAMKKQRPKQEED